MSDARVLVVDDDLAIRQSLERGLRLGGFDVTSVAGGRAALDAIAAAPPDIIVLDVSMPDIDGVEVCRRVRGAEIDVPICILSALDDVEDRVAGLRAGADDYLVKPFALEELELRLRSLLRRASAHLVRMDDLVAGEVVEVGPLRIDVAGRRVTLSDEEVELTRREFELLDALAEEPGVVLSRAQLLERVWGYDFDVQSNVVDVFVGYLRRKLEADGSPRLIHTVRGVGFVLRTS